MDCAHGCKAKAAFHEPRARRRDPLRILHADAFFFGKRIMAQFAIAMSAFF
jgi:hypothetical protein